MLGRTLDQTRIHDVRAALHALRKQSNMESARVVVHGRGPTAEIALFATILEPSVHEVPAVTDSGAVFNIR